MTELDVGWVTILVGIGLFVGSLMTGMVIVMDTEELGQAICDQEYGMDFEDYSSGSGLVCQPKEAIVNEKYDGITVNLPEMGKEQPIQSQNYFIPEAITAEGCTVFLEPQVRFDDETGRLFRIGYTIDETAGMTSNTNMGPVNQGDVFGVVMWAYYGLEKPSGTTEYYLARCIDTTQRWSPDTDILPKIARFESEESLRKFIIENNVVGKQLYRTSGFDVRWILVW